MSTPNSAGVAPKRGNLNRDRAKRKRSKRADVDLDEDREVNRNDPPLVLKTHDNETIAEVADLIKVDQGDLCWLNPGVAWTRVTKQPPEHRPLKPGTTLELPYVDVLRWKHEPRINSRLIPDLRGATDQAKDELLGDDEEYVVDRILRDDDVDGIKQYYVRWKGYGPDSDTWEPASNLQGCPQVIAQYEQLVAVAARGHT
jgi:hypothetical protein